MSNSNVTIVDYGMGNFGSIINMIKRVGGVGEVSSNTDVISRAKKLILPGVGNFDAGSRALHERGLVPALNCAKENGADILGLCLGMQLMTNGSEESDESGLGWFDLNTVKFPAKDEDGKKLLVPHMGWNMADSNSEFSGDTLPLGGRFYFVHSYYVDGAGAPTCFAHSKYGGIEFASGICSGRVSGVQFHPEKSQRHGMALFQAFVEKSQ